MKDSNRPADEKTARYILCLWWGDGDPLFSSDENELEDFRSLHPNAQIFDRGNDRGDYIDIVWKDRTFTIEKACMRDIPCSDIPILEVGCVVQVPNKPPGVVVHRFWHLKRETPYYWVAFNGKRSSCRYFPVDSRLKPTELIPDRGY